MLTSNVAQGAAGFAVALRSKDEDTRELAASAGLTGILGITEPILYGINLRFIYPLVGAMVGGGVGGLFLGLTHVGRFASGSPGLLVLPGYIGGGSMDNFVFACIGVAIAMAVSFIVTFLLFTVWAKQGKLDAAQTGTDPAADLPEVSDDTIVAPVTGDLIAAADIDDPAFASGAMGQTVAVVPADGTVCSPANGTLEMVFDTGHAFGLRMADGTGLLVHIGIDTVGMTGDGFKILKHQGDVVRAGEPVVEVDLAKMRAAGCSTQTMLIVTEQGSGAAPTFIAPEPV